VAAAGALGAVAAAARAARRRAADAAVRREHAGAARGVAFSYLLREGALVRGAAERAGYYNLDASDGGGELGDITRREAVRWGVLPLGTRQLGAG
jgi:hypothetical protein